MCVCVYGPTLYIIRPYWYGKGRLVGIYVDLGCKGEIRGEGEHSLLELCWSAGAYYCDDLRLQLLEQRLDYGFVGPRRAGYNSYCST